MLDANDSAEARSAPHPALPVQPSRSWIRRLTLDQWAAIDAEHRDPNAPPFDLKVAGLFVLIAVLLTIRKFVGSRKLFTDHTKNLVAHLPWPGYWGFVYWSFLCCFVYFIVPALYIRFVLKERIRDFGFRFKGTASHLPLYGVMFMCVFPLEIAASFSEGFLKVYPFYDGAGDTIAQLVAWELIYALQFVTLEFFFRGFTLYVLARRFGAYAVFIMAVPYCMIHHGKPPAEAVGAIVTGIALGTLSLRTRSIIGGIVIHVAVAWSMDLLSLQQQGLLAQMFH